MYRRDGRSVDREELARLRDTMVHRGPDDDGLWLREPVADVGFGHRRLSIVDLTEHGHQPMFNEDGSVAVTFNGEIYNHEALRAELEQRGHRFSSRCDTEVLVHLYEEYGPDMVHRLVGMFAFAVWDEDRQQVFLARDRLGIKPLYFLDDGRTFAFASEIKALLPLLPRRELDPGALIEYLTFVAVPPPRTLFAGVSKLAPAETMVITRKGPQPAHRYWDPIANRVQLDVDPVDWEAELRFRLERSIDRRMMSDVPVGVFLSGGVDSSTNVALMSQLIDDPVNTFSIGFAGDSEFNEFDWARRIAEQFGTRHRAREVGCAASACRHDCSRPYVAGTSSRSFSPLLASRRGGDHSAHLRDGVRTDVGRAASEPSRGSQRAVIATLPTNHRTECPDSDLPDARCGVCGVAQTRHRSTGDGPYVRVRLCETRRGPCRRGFVAGLRVRDYVPSTQSALSPDQAHLRHPSGTRLADQDSAGHD